MCCSRTSSGDLMLYQQHQRIRNGFASQVMDCSSYCLVVGRINDVFPAERQHWDLPDRQNEPTRRQLCGDRSRACCAPFVPSARARRTAGGVALHQKTSTAARANAMSPPNYLPGERLFATSSPLLPHSALTGERHLPRFATSSRCCDGLIATQHGVAHISRNKLHRWAKTYYFMTKV